METTNNYLKQANYFLLATGTELKVEFLKHDKHFEDDKEARDIYTITLRRGHRYYSFAFGQSINNSGFYYQYKTGKTKFAIDRKFLEIHKSKLLFNIRMKDHSFVPGLDILHYPITPSAYDVLACLTKYDPGTFENFCSDFGYSTDSKSAEKIYTAVCDEWKNIQCLYNDIEIELLSEIQ